MSGRRAPDAARPRLPRTAHVHKVHAQADGYQPGVVEFRADRAQTVHLKLKPVAAASSDAFGLIRSTAPYRAKSRPLGSTMTGAPSF